MRSISHLTRNYRKFQCGGFRNGGGLCKVSTCRHRWFHFSCRTHSQETSSTIITNTASHNEHEEDLPYDPFIDPSMELVKNVADRIRGSVRTYTSQNQVKLVGVLASQSSLSGAESNSNYVVDDSADTYSEWIARTCAEDGIDYELWRVAGGTANNTIRQIENLIQRANELQDVHGILVYYPLCNKPYVLGVKNRLNNGGERIWNTKGWSLEHQQLQIDKGCEDILLKSKRALPGLSYKTRDDYFQDSIHPSRDVEGLSPTYHSRNIFRNRNLYVDRYGCGEDENTAPSLSDDDKDKDFMVFPCTALAVVRVLKECLDAYDSTKPIGARFEGVIVTIINRSEILGRPLASMLANDGATVYSIDADSILCYKPNGRMARLPSSSSTSMSSIQSCVEESSVIVTAVPSSAGFKLPSKWLQEKATVINVASEPNVDENELREYNSLTYIPQIGKVTVALLERNLVELHRHFHSTDK